MHAINPRYTPFMLAKATIIIAFLAVLFLPLAVQRIVGNSAPATTSDTNAALRLVIVTPHVEQIREEFGTAFSQWHQRFHNAPVYIDWRTPGGTSDIVKQLEAQFDAAVSNGRVAQSGKAEQGSIGYDLFFGGGSFDHGKMKDKRSGTRSSDGQRIEYRWGSPAGFDQTQLDDWFGTNKIGAQSLYDPEQYWIGTALSGFGIVYNRDVVAALGVPAPTSFEHLTDPAYAGLLALADGRQSGSITTTYDSILNKNDWEQGWRVLRELAGNARYFASSSTKPPVDVSQGEAAAGLAIDFYGRGQSQFVLQPTESADQSRVGYVDPEGAVYIDADPVSILNGASNPDLARRFVEFCLSIEAQALWQFHSLNAPSGAANPTLNGTKLGPSRYELRRMPVRRVMYADYRPYLVDQADPFALASDVPTRGYRPAIGPLMAAFGIDTAEECRTAWRALNQARKAHTAGQLDQKHLDEMTDLFYAMPEHHFQPGSIWWPAEVNNGIDRDALKELERMKVTTFSQLRSAITAATAAAKLKPETIAEFHKLADRASTFEADAPTAIISAKSLRPIRNDTDTWKNPKHGRRSLIAYTEFFRSNYRNIVELWNSHRSRATSQSPPTSHAEPQPTLASAPE